MSIPLHHHFPLPLLDLVRAATVTMRATDSSGVIVVAAIALALVAATHGATTTQVKPYDDFHYPAEERAEAQAAARPSLVSVSAVTSSATFLYKGNRITSSVGGAVGNWTLVGLGSDGPFAVVEREWARWGMLIVLSTDPARNIELRKSVGHLGSIHQPYFNFTGSDPDYFNRISSGLEDIASQIAANLSADGEADYPSLAAVFAPQRDLASISNPEDVVKFVVSYNGRVKCGKTGITE